MLAAPAARFFVPGKIDQGPAATEPAAADAAAQPSVAAPRLPDADISTATAYLDAASDAIVAHATAGCQRDG